MPSDTFSSGSPSSSLVYPSHSEKFTEVIFGQFSSTLMSPIYVYWLCKCQPLLKILRILLRKFLGTRCGLQRNLRKEHSSKQHPPSIELILLRSMLVMSDMSDRSSARVNLPQLFRLTLSLPCFARMSLIKRIILPVKTPVL